jgi:hypothetical protein
MLTVRSQLKSGRKRRRLNPRADRPQVYIAWLKKELEVNKTENVYSQTFEQQPPAYNGQLEPQFSKTDRNFKGIMTTFALAFERHLLF